MMRPGLAALPVARSSIEPAMDTMNNGKPNANTVR